MCSIIGSFSPGKFKQLVALNQSRGQFSFSFMLLNPHTCSVISLHQDFGTFQIDLIDKVPKGVYLLGHTQAPTNGLIRDKNRIHPATCNLAFLFHNGIIKQKDIKRLQSVLKTSEEWDSQLMLYDMIQTGLVESLNTVDGSFSCVYSDSKQLRLFRSAAGVLFVDDDLNISSTYFEGSTRLKKDVVFIVDFIKQKLVEEITFKSMSNPYFLAGA